MTDGKQYSPRILADATKQPRVDSTRQASGPSEAEPQLPVRGLSGTSAHSRGQVLALQRTVGNAAVQRLLQGGREEATLARSAASTIAASGAGATLNRKPGRRPARESSASNHLKEKDSGDVAAFMELMAAQRRPSMPESFPFSNPWLTVLQMRLRGTWALVQGEDKDAPEQVLAHWKSVRSDLDELATWGLDKRFEKSFVKDYREAIFRFEGWFVRWYNNRLVETEAPATELGDPQAALKGAIAQKMIQVATKASELDLLELVPGGDAPPLVEHARTVLNVVKACRTYDEMQDKLKEGKTLEATADAFEIVGTVTEATWTVVSIKANAIAAAGGKVAGPAGKQLLETVEASASALNQVDTATKALGVLGDTLSLVSSSIELVVAVRNGDDQAIIKASAGVAEAGTGLVMTLAGAGLVPVAAVTGLIKIYGEAIVALSGFNDTLVGLQRDERARAGLRMVRDATQAARIARRMAVAWEQSLLRGDAWGSPVEARVKSELEKQSLRLAEELVPHLSRVLSDLDRWRERSDALREAVGDLPYIVRFDGSDPAVIWQIEGLCQTVFPAVSRVSAVLIREAGGLPP